MRRSALTAALTASLTLGLTASAHAAVVISELRLRGPNGAFDEFV